ncbi:primosomal protein N' [Brevibacillus humidisoli]|uniref:primosomal protein N' n=1 Tax=Brevibacillus humidisoli TaxID=2895522 RepID=UPI001E36A8DB|nr:primosomal protein N' [Brevibacillus humidisoli]UFJ43229.1 primosomal protein N' [Brevibacillus humidisoli]
MLAQVIVDVPTARTNRPFDYLVPEALSDRVAVGSRVIVPFGPRKLQGYIVGLQQSEQADLPQLGGMEQRLKPIEQVMDELPPLTSELIQLAEWMSKQYLCPWVTALQAMIPAVLKGKAEKQLAATELLDAAAASTSSLLSELRQGRVLPLSEVEKRFPEEAVLLQGWLKAGWVTLTQRVRDRVTRKQVTMVSLAVTKEEVAELIASLPTRAERMKQVLSYLSDLEQPISMTELLDLLQTSRSTVNSLQKKGWVRIERREVYRDPYEHKQVESQPRHELTDEQAESLAQIGRMLAARQYASFLLHGVTGSGKTEVYMEAIEQTIASGREAIFLVPEISLTPQMVDRFKARFGQKVAVLHSALSQGERYDEWRKIQRQEVQVVVGARSAIFAPFRRLGLIVIDEEHETSYKQEETPRYHARDVAIWRAKQNQAVLVLGSATPSLETYALATRGRYHLLSMRERGGGRSMPSVHLVDMREELRSDNRSMFSRTLHEMIEDRLAKQEQIVLFLNRRGFSTFVMCRSCGYTMRCPHCDISLTYHRTNHSARCHYCGYAVPQPNHCPDCQSPHIRFFGTGTQKVEQELARLFPGVRVIRMDVDTTSRKGAHETLLGRFRSHQGDVLLGTQMIAKGLDFPRVTLVGVIAADTSLHLPDFRAAEKTFQLLTQVGGRAGRHSLAGDVVIQTYTPEHYSIRHATHYDYEGFYQIEMGHRKKTGYPPFYRLVLLTFSHQDVPVVIRAAENYAGYLRPRLSPTTQLLGPVASPIARLKDRFRFQLMLKYRDEPKVVELLAQANQHFSEWIKQHQVAVTIDVDPQMLL